MSARNSLTIKVARFIGLVLGLAVCGAVFAVVGGFIGGGIAGENTFGALGLAILGVVAGYFLGNILGIVLLKKLFRQHGSILLGLVGCVAGVAITVAVGVMLDPDINLFFWIALISVPVLCLVGFYLKR